MDSYRYKARNAGGRAFKGVMQAVDENDLHEKLKKDELFLVSAELIKGKTSSRKLKSDKVAEFARNIGELVASGVSLVRALKIISEDESISPKERAIYANVLRLVRSGIPLSDALIEQGGVFPTLFVNMIKSSESSGNLDQVALQMADYYEKDYKLSQKLSSAFTYPKILCVLIVLVLIIIMGFVIPQFESLFAQMETLPAATRILLAISGFVSKRWYILIFAVIVGVMAIRLIIVIPAVAYVLHKLKLKLPVFGKLNRVIYTARFARTLSSLYSAGIPIVTALGIAKETIGNRYIEKQFDNVIAMVRAGANLSDAINSVDGFVKKLTSSILVGEETGSLDTMLKSTADQMSYDSEIAMNKLVAMVGPAMIVVMAVTFGFIMIAIIQPIYGSYQAIANSYQ